MASVICTVATDGITMYAQMCYCIVVAIDSCLGMATFAGKCCSARSCVATSKEGKQRGAAIDNNEV